MNTKTEPSERNPITLRDLISGARQLPERPDPACATCGAPLTQDDFQAQEVITTTAGLSVHASCYYQALGELVEKHPIVSGGNRRG